MLSFFHGWRRKAGIATLGLALAIFGLWMRSRVVHDAISFGTGHHQLAVFSVNGRITWWSYKLASEKPYNHVGSRAFKPAEAAQIDSSIETTRSLLGAGNDLHELSLRYWFLATFLTLLSAYLILWMPRKRA